MGFSRTGYPAGIHLCYIYSDESRRKEVISRFIASGLLNSERVYYFTDTGCDGRKEDFLSGLGLDVLPEESLRRFSLLTTEEVYYPEGEFVPDEVLGRIGSFYRQSIEEGCAGVRVTGETSWLTRDIPGSSRVMEYEARVNDVLRECPVSAICQYDAGLDKEILRDVLAVHPTIILHGQVVKNPFYIKAWWLLKRYSAPSGGGEGSVGI